MDRDISFEGKLYRGLSDPESDGDENVATSGRLQNCPICEKPFSLFRPRHRCRSCQRKVCENCSRSKMRLNGEKSKSLRTCDVCVQKSFLHSDSPPRPSSSRKKRMSSIAANIPSCEHCEGVQASSPPPPSALNYIYKVYAVTLCGILLYRIAFPLSSLSAALETGSSFTGFLAAILLLTFVDFCLHFHLSRSTHVDTLEEESIDQMMLMDVMERPSSEPLGGT
jgi:hypothetical protein